MKCINNQACLSMFMCICVLVGNTQLNLQHTSVCHRITESQNQVRKDLLADYHGMAIAPFLRSQALRRKQTSHSWKTPS